MTMVERVRDAMRRRAKERPVRQADLVWVVDNAVDIDYRDGELIRMDTIAYWRFNSQEEAKEFVTMEIARAAIKAMREATPMMANAATAMETDAGGTVSVNDVHTIWETMIAAALGEP